MNETYEIDERSIILIKLSSQVDLVDGDTLCYSKCLWASFLFHFIDNVNYCFNTSLGHKIKDNNLTVPNSFLKRRSDCNLFYLYLHLPIVSYSSLKKSMNIFNHFPCLIIAKYRLFKKKTNKKTQK